MTDPFTSADILNMQEAQGIHAYTDTAAYIPPPSLSSLDAYGQPTPSTTETAIACAFVDTAKRENWRDADIEEVEAEIYFSTIAPAKGGRVKILTRFGVAVTNKVFEVTGIQNRGAYGYVCALKAVAV